MSEPTPQIDEIFSAAIEITSDVERADYLSRACAGDAQLFARLQKLLAAHFRAGQFLEAPAAGLPTEIPDDLSIGTMIGPYKLLQQIGEGGMGMVFMAEQQRPVQRRVALKIIKPGMDTKQVIARFEAERQALAAMDHPNIAKVFDAGATDTGRPYFVMELVKGVPITEYCDRNNLTIAQRLELFAQVCNAVQHAHQKGLIHRDIKPSNILVASADDKPLAKVIDFGIAKATQARLTEKTLFTEFQQLIGTPEYMSPEQAGGSLDIDTRTDVYSLGVLLYELLVGSPPFDARELRSKAYVEMQRIIREVDPPAPSTRLSTLDTLPSVAAQRGTEPRKLSASIRGELDWIVMKALEKDRARRYESASSLAADIRHHLADEPVAAGPPSRIYRLRKFVRRHRAPVISATLLLALLIAGIAGTTWGLVRAEAARRVAAERAEGERRAKETAEAREAETKAVLDFVVNKVFAAARPEGQEGGLGREVTMRKAVDAAVPFVEKSFVNRPLIEARLRMTIGMSLLYLGERQRALEQWLRARAIYVEHLGLDHPDTLESANSLANAYDMLGRHTEAVKLHTETLALRKAKLGADDPATLLSMMNLANGYMHLGQHQQALELQRQTLALQQAKLGPDHPDTLKTMNNLSVTYSWLGRYSEALALREQTLALRKVKLGPAHPETLTSMQNLAQIYSNLGRYDEALKLHEETLALMKAKLGPRHPETLRAMHNIANVTYLLGRHPQAVALAEESLALRSAELGPQHPDTFGSMHLLANVYEKAGRQSEALKIREETVRLRSAVLGPDHPETLHSMNNLAVSYTAAGRHPEALKLHEQVLEQRKAKFGDDHPDTLLSLGNMAASLVDVGRGAEAIPLIDDCIARSAGKVLGDTRVIPWVMEHRLAYFEKARDAAGSRQTAEMWEKLGRTDADSFVTAARLRATTAAVIGAAGPSAAQQAGAEADRAMTWLRQSVAAGYKDTSKLAEDPALKPLRWRPDFQALLALSSTRPATTQPTTR